MKKYLIIGSGRWALHLEKSLALAGVPTLRWARSGQFSESFIEHRSSQDQSFQNLLSEQTPGNSKWILNPNSSEAVRILEQDLADKLKQVSHVWLAISDQALPEWAQRLCEFTGLKLHSSGALEIEGLHSVHPLMTFGPTTYDDIFYSKYAFVTTSPLPQGELIPGLPNPYIQIRSELKALYHALCVLSGNGSVLLWQKFLHGMRGLGIPQDSALLYTERVFQNLLHDPGRALTGPLVRNDQITLKKDLEALEHDPFQTVLQSLIVAYQNNGKDLAT